jgi:integrase/recombinase XerC
MLSLTHQPAGVNPDPPALQESHPTPVRIFSGPEQRRRELYAAFLEGLKPNTLRAYKTDLAAFGVFAGFATAEEAISWLFGLAGPDANYTALRWRNDMQAAGLSASSVSRRLAALKSLGKAARMVGACSWTLEVVSPHVQPLRDTAGPGELGWAAIRQVAIKDRTPQGIRDLAIVTLAHNLGLRRNEIASLDLSHVDVETSREHGIETRRVTAVHVLGKGQDERARLSVPLATSRPLADWLDVRGDTPGAFFWRLDRGATEDRGRLSGEAIRLVCLRLGVAAGLPRVLKPHGLRHCGITACLEANGGNVRQAAKFSRHKNLNTLLHYDDCRRDVFGQMAELVAGD